MKKMLFIIFVMLLSIIAEASSLRIELKELVQNPSKYKIIDTRDEKAYDKGHIHNAINFPVKLTYENKKTNGKLTNPIKMQEIVQNLGLDADDALVIYDNGSFFEAGRLFWSLEVYGFKNVKLLNAGYAQWKFKGLPTSVKKPAITKSNYITTIDNNRLTTKLSTQIAIKNPNQIIIDARPNKAYLGKVSSAKRYGHIPKAKNIPATHNIDNIKTNTAKLKDIKDLKSLYKDLDKNKKIILYCAIGKISSTNYFALRELGYDVSNYDASWKEWGNDFKLPVVNPSSK